MIAPIEIACRNCRDVFACDRVPEPQLCPSCEKLEPWQHRGTCECEVCQCDEQSPENPFAYRGCHGF